MLINHKTTTKMKMWGASLLLFMTQACHIEGDNLTLGDLPTPDFEVEDLGQGHVRLTNTTDGPNIAKWTVLSSGQKLEGDVVEANLIFEGTYEVRLEVVAQGGMTSVTKEVSVSESDAEACGKETLLGFLASCTQKTWKLNPAAGAIKVGPGVDNGDWWSNSVSDVTGRTCEFNDEFTFSFNAEGTFTYDNKGDFFADGYLGNKSTSCEPAENLKGEQAAWNSGTFRFAVVEGTGVKGLGQLRLIGKGAHIGVKKAHNAGETPEGPTWDEVLYDVIDRESDVDGQGYDLLKIGVEYGDNSWWTFTLRSSE